MRRKKGESLVARAPGEGLSEGVPAHPAMAVLQAADAHNAAQGFEVGADVPKQSYDFVFHMMRVENMGSVPHGSPSGAMVGPHMRTLCGEALESGAPIATLAPLDHPAFCQACLQAYRERSAGRVGNRGAAVKSSCTPVMVRNAPPPKQVVRGPEGPETRA